jgi:RNA ligase
MVYLKDVFSVDKLREHVKNGVVRRQVHPQYPDLFIYNYTEVAQFDRIWDEVTNVCRGLIVHECDEPVVVARPFRKFHNLNTSYVPETMEENLPKDTPPICTQKLDGSMGVLYTWDDKLWVATRGSFASEQAIWATNWVRQNLNYKLYPADSTPVFEIIYHENRIVVDYDFEGLVLLGIIHNATGKEYDFYEVRGWALQWAAQVVETFDKTLAECVAEDNPNEEGYVLTYSNGVKVKVKFVEYLRLHRILTGLQPRAIWEMLVAKQNEAIDTLLNDPKTPASFKVWFGGWVNQLRTQFADLENTTLVAFAGRPDDSLKDVDPKGWRKAQALHFQKTPGLTSALFAMLDGKDYAEPLWKKLYPAATGTFQKDGES